MKKLLVILLVVFMATVALADNTSRLSELRTKQNAIVIEINQREAIINAQQSAIEGLRAEYIKTQGAIEELERQDKESKKK